MTEHKQENVEITTAAVEPPELYFPTAKPFEWICFASYPNYLIAAIYAGLLENEGVPTIIRAGSVIDLETFIWVPEQIAHRARWIFALQAPGLEELDFLATGKLVT